ncbi:CocE/NonD family hydrolase [Mesorhizobium sp. NBSH29]|uniref:CocE/NonD family hydrolase n=1 Tax=Mesorhizobium sp. NBSH29 TaxID=2654249 RepID=UPI001896930D|nr:CocE/NonD family hydrolase [Mesorhizobium sp. NBSH29]QPC85547.1 CocE/NonD family hydrolase [Mesorhizobium sp. NBSH29]
MKTVTDFPRAIEERPDVAIIMPDGCRLSARMWLPKDAEKHPVPAILEHLPYRKRDGTNARDALTHPYFAGHGYAAIRVDMRGNGDSEGVMEDEYSEQELQDAADVIAWAASQPWCSGRVGMMGISWGGFNALQVAARQPEALKAIITLCSTDDRYADDIHYKGGMLLNENMGWGATMLSYSSRPPDPALVGDSKWREMWYSRLEHEPFLPAQWLKHQRRDVYWKRGSVCEDFSEIKAATLAIGGWGDAYKNAVSRIVTGVEAPAKGIIGPWVHKYPHFAVPQPAIGFLQEALRWWDRWLKDIETGVENDPEMRVYVMDSVAPKEWYNERPGRWIATEAWTNTAPQSVSFHLADSGALTTEPATLAPQRIASPQDCGIAGGEYCAIWLGPELPGDQRIDDEKSLCFDSDPLEEPCDIVGTPIMRLKLSADRARAMVAVRLCEVQPNGASTRISYGVLNLCHRNSHEFPEDVLPGRVMEVTVKLDDIAYRAVAGNRLRIAISSSYWPMVWPSPQPVALTVCEGSLVLPLAADDASRPIHFPDPEGATPWQTETLREGSNTRKVGHNSVTGRVLLEIVDDFGEIRDCDHGLVNGSIARESWSIDPSNPLSAEGETHWSQTLSRSEWSVRTETFTKMRSNAETFHLTGRILAYEGEKLVFERNFEESVARDFL